MKVDGVLELIVDELIRSGNSGCYIHSCLEQFDKEYGPQWRLSFPQLKAIFQCSDCGWSDSDYSCVIGLDALIRSKYVSCLRDPEVENSLVERAPSEIRDAYIADPDGLVPFVLLESINRGNKFWVPSFPVILGDLHVNSHLDAALRGADDNERYLVRIRPDLLKTVKFSDKVEWIQKDRWSGRPFTNDWLSSIRNVEEAEHFPSEGQRGLKTQFIWEPKGAGVIQFAVEELPDFNDEGRVAEFRDDLVIFTRFAHGIYHSDVGMFEHVDGHIHIYSSTAFQERQSLRLKSHFPKYDKHKMFSIDTRTKGEGVVPAQLAFDILCTFFRGNEMVNEYFFG